MENALNQSAATVFTANQEADFFRRKVELARTFKDILADKRDNGELSLFASTAENELAAADEACRFARFAAASQCLDRAEAAFRALRNADAKRDESDNASPANAAAIDESADDEPGEDADGEVTEWLDRGNAAFDNDDISEAAKWFRMAAGKGNAEAQYKLGCLFYNGDGDNENCTEAIKWLKKSAEQGNPDAQNQLGWIYGCMSEEGRSDSDGRDAYAESAKWYLMAAEQGDIDAQFEIGCDYEHGSGVTQDYAKAEKWYRSAAEAGNINAQYRLGCLYGEGQHRDYFSYGSDSALLGIPRDDKEAARWLTIAAEHDPKEDFAYATSICNSQACLAIMYANGIGFKQSDEEAMKWYRSVMENRDDECKKRSWQWWDKKTHTYFSTETVMKLCRIVAEQGDADAQSNIARCYAWGHGVLADYAEAAKWYRKAAEQGDADAQHALAGMLGKGKGVQQDYAEAAEWCRRSAEQGNAWAQYDLGLMYEEGRGVSRDYADAMNWYRKAAEHQRGAAGAASNAQYRIGLMYEKGLGGPPSLTDAEYWYRQAAQSGNTDAQDKINRMNNEGGNNHLSEDISQRLNRDNSADDCQKFEAEEMKKVVVENSRLHEQVASLQDDVSDQQILIEQLERKCALMKDELDVCYDIIGDRDRKIRDF